MVKITCHRAAGYWIRSGVALTSALLGSCTSDAAPPSMPLSFELIEQHPHDDKTFTQGLEVYNGHLIESSGLYRRSFLRLYNPETQEIHKHIDLPANFFAEGLTRVKDKVYVLTWRAGKALVFDLPNWQHVHTYDYEGQGWGLCYDGQQLFMSDGSHFLTVRDPQTFEIKKKLAVTDQDKKITKLNELECAEGHIWANQWMSTNVFQIDPETGQVRNTLDLSDLVPFQLRKNREAVLNGIAYDEKKNAYWITGKYWNKLFLIQMK